MAGKYVIQSETEDEYDILNKDTDEVKTVKKAELDPVKARMLAALPRAADAKPTVIDDAKSIAPLIAAAPAIGIPLAQMMPATRMDPAQPTADQVSAARAMAPAGSGSPLNMPTKLGGTGTALDAATPLPGEAERALPLEPIPAQTAVTEPPPMIAAVPQVPKIPEIPGVGGRLAGAAANFDMLQGRIDENTKKDIEARKKAADEQEKAIFEAQKLGQAEAAEEAAFNRRMRDEQVVDNVLTRRREEDRRKHVQELTDKYNALSNDLAEAKIQPWADRVSTGQKIHMAIAAGLMAWGAGLAGGDQGIGIRFIQDAINRDMEIQKEEINRKREAVGTADNLLALTRQQFDDERTGEAAARAMKWKAVEYEAAEVAAKQKGKREEANANKMVADVRAQRVAAEGDLQRLIDNQAVGIAAQKADIAAQRDALDAARGNAVITAMGKAAEKDKPKQLSEAANDKLATLKSQSDNLTQIQEEFDKKTTGVLGYWWKNIPLTDNNEYEQMREAWAVKIAQAISGADVSDAQMETIKKLIPTAGMLESTAKTKLAALKRMIDTELKNKIQSLKASGYDTSGPESLEDVGSFAGAE